MHYPRCPRRKPSVERNSDMTIRANASIRSFIRDEAGATAIEYGLIATAVFFGMIPIVNVIMHEQLGTVYETIATYFDTVGA
jgi:Flp pilus assembly pilin Flp